MQVTRGAENGRNHAPLPDVARTVFAFASPWPEGRAGWRENGLPAVTAQDTRWARCDIKSVSLLPNILGKQKAAEAGAYEAWQVDADGMVTEGTSTNAWIVTPDRKLVTRDLSAAILSGITRKRLIAVAAEKGYPLEERAFTVAEAKAACEAFLTSSTSLVLPVSRLDGQAIGEGSAGPLSLALRQAYVDFVMTQPAVL